MRAGRLPSRVAQHGQDHDQIVLLLFSVHTKGVRAQPHVVLLKPLRQTRTSFEDRLDGSSSQWCKASLQRHSMMLICMHKQCPRSSFALQVLKQHHKAISDLDWSLENTFLLSAGLDGSVSMWLAATGQLLRVFLTASAALCSRFHLVNQNLVMAGTESGIVQVFNCSTGKSFAGCHPPIIASCCLATCTSACNHTMRCVILPTLYTTSRTLLPSYKACSTLEPLSHDHKMKLSLYCLHHVLVACVCNGPLEQQQQEAAYTQLIPAASVTETRDVECDTFKSFRVHILQAS